MAAESSSHVVSGLSERASQAINQGSGPIEIQSRLGLSKSVVVLTSSSDLQHDRGPLFTTAKGPKVGYPVPHECRSSFCALRLKSEQRRIFPALHKLNVADREVYLAGVHLNI